MPVREKPSPEKQSMRSLKAALMIATVIAFGLLHVVGSALLPKRTAPRQSDITETMMNRD
jgi:hypothetical protein